MASALILQPLTGPIRIATVTKTPITLRLATGSIGISILGQPGPQGATGPQGVKGDQGAPGITILPDNAPINGGFF